jgi:aminopeptidase N
MAIAGALLGILALGAGGPTGGGTRQERPGETCDPRTAYDVLTYRLDLRVDPAERRIEGTAALEARALAAGLDEIVLDMHRDLEAQGVVALEGALDGSRELFGRPLPYRRDGDRIVCELAAPAAPGSTVRLGVRYAASPRARNNFDGFHWRETEDGRPWIGTSFQMLGSHAWWPCKDSFFHPEDKHERLFLAFTVPAGLTAVGNGRLVGPTSAMSGWTTFRWEHPYPCPTYAVTLNVGPYVALEGELELPGSPQPVPHAYYVLPESVDKARVQFAALSDVLSAYSEAFGPWPFPDAKIGLVETSFWGMEHSTAVAYGSSYPDWIASKGAGERDPYAARNRWFDYILVHELAHEWWGNSVSAADWGDLWLHEGFATYAEGVYVEHRRGREEADRFFAEQASYVHPKAVLYRGRGTNFKQAFTGAVYSKGATVLNTLRHYVDDDELWWRFLREFQERHRFSSATTEDFRALLEELSGSDWSAFFEQWVHGSGYPRLSGRVLAQERAVVLEIDNPSEPTPFDVPLDLSWREGPGERRERVWLAPGANRLELPAAARPEDLRVLHLERLLGRHSLRVEP